jgi:spore maturation protein CgeB
MDHYRALQNVVWYNNVKEIAPTLESLLKDEKKLTEVGAAARAEVLAKHTHTHRIKKILECL